MIRKVAILGAGVMGAQIAAQGRDKDENQRPDSRMRRP